MERYYYARRGVGSTRRESVADFDTFFDAYIATALWSSIDADGTPLDDIDVEFDAEDLESLREEAAKFYEENYTDIIAGAGKVRDADVIGQAGHDFWLTRNGHGAGFWDGDWREPQATRLTKAAERFGKVDLYIGDDDLLYADLPRRR